MPTVATLSGKQLLHPGELRSHTRIPLDFWQRANSYWCPLGAEPGVAWVLLQRNDLDDLAKNSFHSLVFRHDDSRVTIGNLSIVKSTTMSLSLTDDPAAAMLVKLEDKRRQMAMSNIDKQYNVRIPAPSTTSGSGLYYTASLNGGSPWTWQEMVDDIWGTFPTSIRGTAPTLPYTPSAPPEEWRFIGEWSWPRLHDSLASIGCTTTYNPIAGTFGYVRLGTSQGIGAAISTLQAARKIIYDFDPGRSYRLAEIPETVRVYFFRREEYHGIEKDTSDSGNWEMSPSESKDYATGFTGALAGTVATVWDDLPALVDSAGTVSNDSALQTRADEVGANYANRIDVSDEPTRKIYSSISTSILPGSEIAEVIWRDYGDATGMVTEIIGRRLPTGEGESTNQPERLTTPDFNRNQYPLWPRVSQLVQVDDGASATGAELTANGDGLFEGFVFRYTGSYAALDPCWIRPTDLASGTTPSEATVVNLRQKDRLIGRLSSSQTSGGDTRPVYLVRKGVEGEASTIMWGVAKTNWESNRPSSCDSVDINPVDNCEGDNPVTGTTVTVMLPSSAEQDPNVIAAEVIAYQMAAGSQHVCVSDYVDDKIGTVKMWALGSAGIPPGWAIMNGSANSSGSAIDMTGFFPRGAAAASNTGGGTSSHTHNIDIVVFPHFVEELSHTHTAIPTLPPHTQAELTHNHGQNETTPTDFDVWENDSEQHLPVGRPADCTDGPIGPVDGVVGLGTCGSGDAWGPLYHDINVEILPGNPPQLDHTAVGTIDSAQHIPPFKDLIFIERIDNSA